MLRQVYDLLWTTEAVTSMLAVFVVIISSIFIILWYEKLKPRSSMDYSGKLLSLNDLNRSNDKTTDSDEDNDESIKMMCPFLAAFKATKAKEKYEKEQTLESSNVVRRAEDRLEKTVENLVRNINFKSKLCAKEDLEADEDEDLCLDIKSANFLKKNFNAHYKKEEDNDEKNVQKQQLAEIYNILAANPEIYGFNNQNDFKSQISSLYDINL